MRRDTHTHTHTHRERQTHTERERDRDRDSQRDTLTHTHTRTCRAESGVLLLDIHNLFGVSCLPVLAGRGGAESSPIMGVDAREPPLLTCTRFGVVLRLPLL